MSSVEAETKISQLCENPSYDGALKSSRLFSQGCFRHVLPHFPWQASPQVQRSPRANKTALGDAVLPTPQSDRPAAPMLFELVLQLSVLSDRSLRQALALVSSDCDASTRVLTTCGVVSSVPHKAASSADGRAIPEASSKSTSRSCAAGLLQRHQCGPYGERSAEVSQIPSSRCSNSVPSCLQAPVFLARPLSVEHHADRSAQVDRKGKRVTGRAETSSVDVPVSFVLRRPA